MYAQSFFVTSVRGNSLSPTTSLSAGLGFIGFMNAALGCLPAFFLAMRSPLSIRVSQSASRPDEGTTKSLESPRPRAMARRPAAQQSFDPPLILKLSKNERSFARN